MPGDLYETLGLDKTATKKQIQDSYKTLVGKVCGLMLTSDIATARLRLQCLNNI